MSGEARFFTKRLWLRYMISPAQGKRVQVSAGVRDGAGSRGNGRGGASHHGNIH